MRMRERQLRETEPPTFSGKALIEAKIEMIDMEENNCCHDNFIKGELQCCWAFFVTVACNEVK